MIRTFCERCHKEIKSDTYTVRVILVNADTTAPKNAVDKTGHFHPNCAAWLFRAFDGADYAEDARAA